MLWLTRVSFAWLSDWGCVDTIFGAVENQSIVVAEQIVDRILEAGAKIQYDKYLRPKIRPFTALSVIEQGI